MIPTIVSDHNWIDPRTMLPSLGVEVLALCPNYGIDGERRVKRQLLHWFAQDAETGEWVILDNHNEPLKWRPDGEAKTTTTKPQGT